MQPKYYGAAANYNKPAGGIGGLGGILKIFGLFVGVMLILASAFSLVGSLSKGPQDEFTRLTARESSLSALLEKQKSNIRDTDLRTINATATLLAAGDVKTLKTQLVGVFGVEEIAEDIVAAESNAETEETLKKALLTGTFDKIYLEILRERIAASRDLAQSIAAGTNNKAIRTATQTTVANLTAIDTQLIRIRL